MAEWQVGTGFVVVACLAILAQALVLLRAVLGPLPKYRLSSPQPEPLESEEFLYMLEALTDSKVNRRTRLDVHTNGNDFYEAELAAMRAAEKTINLEAYIFHTGRIAERYRETLTERARAGVKVNVLLDGLGSVMTTDSFFGELCAAGGRVVWYHAVKWYTLPNYNNRTHRELLIIDGKTGFIGGAGVADQWYSGKGGNARWRDTMVRVAGDAVPNLQATFAENWLEAQGELLTGEEYFPLDFVNSDTVAMVIASTPTAGGGSRARTLFQLLLSSAQKSIAITTPYFLPDQGMTEALLKAHARGVSVRLIVPGTKADHFLTRSSSRRSYGKLLRAGVSIYEYQPAMIHAKILIVDGLWAVVGSTNMDHRSFGVNDEVNLAARDRAFASRLEEDFARDLAASRLITYPEWKRRPLLERAPELLGWVLQRQQ